ncbi:TIGR02444 family protein [Meridianimarinicoccus sp. MJW13]|uniref:TIGR02444 family protein n=1 Tax=Meridianimarinicoccus sp. MJW13 TaxID=2720031 RepID=UPI0018667E6A|nr:TIGR02444 family protein [Fluviibacterium sp. MJW13]
MALDLENPAWAFALDFYGRPGVAEACLTLQDRLDADIVELVIVLYAWSMLGMSLCEAEGAELRAEMQGWREMTVLPLRHIRRALKPPRSDMPYVTKEILRDQVKRAELLAEQMQIAWAEAWLTHIGTTGSSTDLYPVPAWFLAIPNGDPMPESCTQAFAVIVQTAIGMKQ